MSQLLVSVRSPEEAQAAVAGGAALIDVKEPNNGSLGRAKDATVALVLKAVGGRRPVSAALGELRDHPESVRGVGLTFAKWGLAGLGGSVHWPLLLRDAITRLREANPACRAVAVAYADWQRADAPDPEAVAAFAAEHGCGAFLLDTFRKDGGTLLDWLPKRALERFCRVARSAGVPVALAGSLGVREIRALLDLAPDWFAVRGAVCGGGRRERTVDVRRVRQLCRALQPVRRARCES